MKENSKDRIGLGEKNPGFRVIVEPNPYNFSGMKFWKNSHEENSGFFPRHLM
jgi:hypothetical protein